MSTFYDNSGCVLLIDGKEFTGVSSISYSSTFIQREQHRAWGATSASIEGVFVYPFKTRVPRRRKKRLKKLGVYPLCIFKPGARNG